MQKNPRTEFLLVILALGVLAVVAREVTEFSESDMMQVAAEAISEVPTTPLPPFDSRALPLEVLYAAEQVEDPVERCLNYPLPPDFQVDPDALRVRCERLRSQWDYAEQFRLLNEGNWDELEGRVMAALEHYLDTAEGETEAYAYLDPFQDDSHWTRTITQAWLAERPRSPVAMVARAQVLGDQAATIRWGRPVRRLSDEERAEHNAIRSVEQALLTQAIALEPRFLPAIDERMDYGAWESWELMMEYYDMGVALAPASYRLRSSHLHYLKPQWYGSLEEMRAYVEASKPALSASDGNYLQGLLVDQLALEHRMNDEWAHAIALYDAELARFPTGRLWDLSASAAEALGAEEQAFHRLSLAVAQAKNDHDWQHKRARTLMAMDRNEWAREVLYDVIETYPSYRYAWGSLASLEWNMGNHETSIALHEAVVRHHPDYHFSHQQLASIHIFETRQIEEAKPHIDAMLEIDPESYYGWLYLVNYLEDTGGEGLIEASQNFLRYVDSSDENVHFSIDYVTNYLQQQGAEVPANGR